MDTTTTLLDFADQQPCGCPACDGGVQHGHFACSQSPAVLVQLERKGYLTRHYDGTSWVWERTNKRLVSERIAADRR